MMLKIIYLTLIVFLTSCSYSNEPSNNSKPDDSAECRTDSQCVSVARSCCGCTAGGGNKALSKEDQQHWLSTRAENCAATICPSVMSKDPSCSAIPVCINGKCELKTTSSTKLN